MDGGGSKDPETNESHLRFNIILIARQTELIVVIETLCPLLCRVLVLKKIVGR